MKEYKNKERPSGVRKKFRERGAWGHTKDKWHSGTGPYSPLAYIRPQSLTLFHTIVANHVLPLGTTISIHSAPHCLHSPNLLSSQLCSLHCAYYHLGFLMLCKIWLLCPHPLPLITSIYSFLTPPSLLFTYCTLFHPNLLQSAPMLPPTSLCPTYDTWCITYTLFCCSIYILVLPFIPLFTYNASHPLILIHTGPHLTVIP